jgi:hypothetical protein
LVAGAALIPHMWVLSCLVLLTLIALLALHDVRRNRNLRQQYLRIFGALDQDRDARKRS